MTASDDLHCSSVVGSTEFSTVSGDLEGGADPSCEQAKATSGSVRLGGLTHGATAADVSGNVEIGWALEHV